MHSREKIKGAPRRLPLKIYIHQWLGRTISLLGFAQVPLGLTLYGSPKWTFITYALWMFFLLVLFFVLSYRARPIIGEGLGRSTSYGGSVISEKKSGRFGGLLGPLAAGAIGGTLLSRKSRERSQSRSHVISDRRGSRHASGSFIEEDEKTTTRRKASGGFTDKLLKGAALVGAAGLAKSWYDRRQRNKHEDEYSSVENDTPPKRRSSRSRRYSGTEISEDSISRIDTNRRTGPILPGPGNPVAAAAAISAAESGPVTPKPVRRRDSYDSRPAGRRDSYDSDYSYYDPTLSPSRRTQKSHGARNGILAGIGAALGAGWFSRKMKDRKERKDFERQDREEADRVEMERMTRQGGGPAKFTGDGFPAGRHGRRGSVTHSSDLSSVIDDPHGIRPGAIPPVPSALASTIMTEAPAGATAGSAINQSRSRHDISEIVSMPVAPPDPHGMFHEDSGSEAYNSAGGHPHRRHSTRRRQEGEAAAAAAVAGAASLAAEEEARRRRSRSRHGDGSGVVTSGGIETVASPPVSVKMQIHNDKDRRVTLRRLTEQEAAAEREAKRSERRRRRDSVSSMSGTDISNSRRRFRRDQRDAAEGSVSAPPPPPVMEPLSPPNPAFAGGRYVKKSIFSLM